MYIFWLYNHTFCFFLKTSSLTQKDKCLNSCSSSTFLISSSSSTGNLSQCHRVYSRIVILSENNNLFNKRIISNDTSQKKRKYPTVIQKQSSLRESRLCDWSRNNSSDHVGCIPEYRSLIGPIRVIAVCTSVLLLILNPLNVSSV